MKIGRQERTKLHVLDGFMAGELWNSLGISEENAPNFSRRQIGEGAGESGVEDPGHREGPGISRARTRARGRYRRGIAGSGSGRRVTWT